MRPEAREKAFAAMRTRIERRGSRREIIWNRVAALDRVAVDHEQSLKDWQFPIRMTSMYSLIEQFADRGGSRRVAPAPRA